MIVTSIGSLRVSPGYSITQVGCELKFIGDRVVSITVPSNNAAKSLRLLLDGEAWEASSAALSEEEKSVSEGYLEELIRMGIIIDRAENRFFNTPYEKQVDFFFALGLNGSQSQELLASKNVLILGVGGTGSVVLQHLVGAGIGKVTLIDSDSVSIHNLNRQFIFKDTDVGQPKVEAAHNYIRSQGVNTEVISFNCMITSERDLQKVINNRQIDFVVLAADTPPGEITGIVAKICMKNDIPFIRGSVGLSELDWGPLVHGNSPVRYVSMLDRMPITSSPEDFPLPITASFGCTNSFCGVMIARDVIFFLAGLEPTAKEKMVIFNWKNMEFRHVQL